MPTLILKGNKFEIHSLLRCCSIYECQCLAVCLQSSEGVRTERASDSMVREERREKERSVRQTERCS